MDNWPYSMQIDCHCGSRGCLAGWLVIDYGSQMSQSENIKSSFQMNFYIILPNSKGNKNNTASFSSPGDHVFGQMQLL